MEDVLIKTTDNRIEEEDIDNSLYIDLSNIEEGYVESDIGKIKKIKTELTPKDIFHDFYARCKINRNNFRIPTGIYGIGNPDKMSPVLVTANYKLTLDKLRCELTGLDIWLLVIDTKGINVWCAAGKGTFGTDEIIYRVKKVKLEGIVSHRNLILPQLGAPGVVAHRVTEDTGFRVIYGPIRSKDIKEFISRGYKTTPEMRKVTFGFMDRLILTPMEIMISIKYMPLIFLVFIIINYMGGSYSNISDIVRVSMLNSIPYIGALFIGTILLPALLPIIPFRAFALKGVALGIIWSIIVLSFHEIFLYENNPLVAIGNTMLLTSIVAVIGLNFTGSTTYTSFSGVQRETLLTIPIASLISLVGLVLLITNKFV